METFMHPLFTVHGYTAEDPLDRVSASVRYTVSILTAAVISMFFLFLIFNVLSVAGLKYSWLFWVEVAVLALIYTPLIVSLRKASSLVIMFLLMAAGIPLDLFLEAQYRNAGMQALWWYNVDGPLGSLPSLLQIFIVWTGDAFVAGPMTLWCIRSVIRIMNPSGRPVKNRNTETYRALYNKDWTHENIDKPARGFDFLFLRALGLVYAFYFLLLIAAFLGTAPYPAAVKDFLDMSFLNPALTINAFVKISLMIVLSFTGAYNKELRYHSSLALLAGHLVSTVVSAGLYINNPDGVHAGYLLASAVVDLVLVAVLGVLMLRSRNFAGLHRRRNEFPVFYSVPYRLTKIFYYTFGTVLLLIVPGVLGLRLLLDGTGGWGAIYGFPDPQVANTITKYATLSLLAFIVAERESLRETLGKAIVFAYMLSVAASGIWLLVGGMLGEISLATRYGTAVTEDWYFMLNVLMDGAVVVLILSLRKMYYTVEYSIIALSPSNARNVLALHDALYGTGGNVRNDVLLSIDKHVAGIRGRRRGLLNFPFWLIEHGLVLIYGLRPGFSAISREEQRYFIRKYVLRNPIERDRAMLPPLAEQVYKIGTAVHALITLAHYSQLNERKAIGYIPPDARDRLQGDYPAFEPPLADAAPLPDGPGHPANYKPNPQEPPAPLVAPRVVTPVGEPDIPDEVDYLVIGSGAGGALMAYRLACEVSDPERVLVVERGPRLSPLQDFNDDEMEMVRKLYKDGGLQMSKRFDLIVLQGECVGGTTVINNAICFPMPEHIRRVWENDYGIDLSGIDAAFDITGKELEISPVSKFGINTRVKEKFLNGVSKFNSGVNKEEELRNAVLYANQRNENGDGVSNLGNKRLRKLSMLETYIPWAEARGVKVVGNTSAVRFTAEGDTAVKVLLRSRIGTMKEVRINRSIVVAAGVIASSHFLMRSGVQKNVGNYLSCNFAFPFTFEFEDTLDAFDGTQITLGALDPANRAVFETYFNPPGSFSISLPFYFERHRRTMERYRNMVNFGALVGSEPNGVIHPKAHWLDGRAFTWMLGDRDVEHIKYAFRTLLDIGVSAGAVRAIIPMEPGVELPLTEMNIERFRKALFAYSLSMEDLRLTTAHPQGGNRMTGSRSRHKETRVVDEQFRVDGFRNVFVADASLFPTGITINPQWTILALSSLASRHVLEG
jgi:hypothetical protein